MTEKSVNKILAFHRYVVASKDINNEIGNMDEIPFIFDSPLNRNIESKGAQTVTIKTTRT